jgi:Flp pilus assembly protein protease CpaA
MNVLVPTAIAVLTGWAAWTDLRRMIIPNRLTFTFALGGVLAQTAAGGAAGLTASCAGALAGAVPLFILYALRGAGAGDVKWFAAFGAWAGVWPTIWVFVWSVLAAGGIAAFLLLWRIPPIRWMARKIRWPWGAHPVSGRGVRFPFMLAVAPAVLALLVRTDGFSGWKEAGPGEFPGFF